MKVEGEKDGERRRRSKMTTETGGGEERKKDGGEKRKKLRRRKRRKEEKERRKDRRRTKGGDPQRGHSAHPPARRGKRRHSVQAQRPRPVSTYHAGRLEDAAHGARELPVHLHLLHGGAARRRAVPEGAPVGGRRARAPRSSTPPRACWAVLPGRGETGRGSDERPPPSVPLFPGRPTSQGGCEETDGRGKGMGERNDPPKKSGFEHLFLPLWMVYLAGGS